MPRHPLDAIPSQNTTYPGHDSAFFFILKMTKNDNATVKNANEDHTKKKARLTSLINWREASD